MDVVCCRRGWGGGSGTHGGSVPTSVPPLYRLCSELRARQGRRVPTVPTFSLQRGTRREEELCSGWVVRRSGQLEPKVLLALEACCTVGVGTVGTRRRRGCRWSEQSRNKVGTEVGTQHTPAKRPRRTKPGGSRRGRVGVAVLSLPTYSLTSNKEYILTPSASLVILIQGRE